MGKKSFNFKSNDVEGVTKFARTDMFITECQQKARFKHTVTLKRPFTSQGPLPGIVPSYSGA